MGRADIGKALEGIHGFVAGRGTRAAIVARRILGHSDPKDAEQSDHLIRELRRRTRIDGSMGGALADTALSAWELMELGCRVDCAGLVRMVGYVLAQQDKPGHFAEGCTPDTHEHQHCHHFLAGFFSPGGRDTSIAPLALPTGVTFDTEDEARLAASLLALRSVLRAGEDRRQSVRDHVSALLGSDLIEDPWDSGRNPDMFFLLVGAVASGPPQSRVGLTSALSTLLARQERNGTWAGTHFFHALEMLSGTTGAEARQAQRNAVDRLCSAQRPNGAFDDDDNEEWVLIAARTLIAAGEAPTNANP